MKSNRMKEHAIHTRYMRLMKISKRHNNFQVERRVDALDYHLPPYHGSQYRGYKRWLMHSSDYRRFRIVLNGLMEDIRDEIN